MSFGCFFSPLLETRVYVPRLTGDSVTCMWYRFVPTSGEWWIAEQRIMRRRVPCKSELQGRTRVMVVDSLLRVSVSHLASLFALSRLPFFFCLTVWNDESCREIRVLL